MKNSLYLYLGCALATCVGVQSTFAELLYEPSSYAAQDNIVVNLDGIRNAGLLKAHDNNAAEWKNIGRAANDATFTAKEGDTSGWVADGYHFAGAAFGKLKGKQNLGGSMTIQIVCDVRGSENSTSWPTFFGCPEDWVNIYYSNPSSEIIHFKADAITGLSYTGRSALNNWGGRYLNAALDSSAHKQILVQSDSFQTGWKEGPGGTQGAPGSLNWYFGSCGSSQSALDARYLVGTIKAIRVYNKVLSNTELAANRVIDEVRFFNGIPVTNVVVATAVAGLEGNEGSGVYAYDDAGYTFTAPQKATKDGVVYSCAGYTLETWNGTAWSAPVSYASCAYTATDTSAKVRLTWQWQRAHAAISTALDPLFDDYVTDGLIFHLDGIRNVGADKPHDFSSSEWIDLARGNVGSFQHDFADDSTWKDDGYYFGGRSFAQFFNGIPSLTNTVTVQVVCDVTTNSLLQFKLSRDPYVLWPNLVSSADNDQLNIFYDMNGNPRNRLTFKNANGGNVNLANDAACDTWEGRYVTAIRNGTMNYIFQTTNIADAVTKAAASANIAVSTMRVGGANSSLSSRNQRWFFGTIKAVRIYDRVLSDDELAQNRLVDEARFFGAPLAAGVVVASSVRGVNGNEPEGEYALPAGGHTFTAPATVTVGDDTYSCTGYTLETWDGSAWGAPASHNGVLSAALTDTTAKVRLTWQWTHTAGPGYDAAFSDYATDGLVVHLDGIRNTGLASVHDSSAVTWADLSDIGGCAQFVHASTDGSAWTKDGYRFGGKSYAVMNGLRTLDTAFTIQIVSEVDTYANCRMATTWPALLGTTAGSGDPLPIYLNNNNNNNSYVNCKVGNSNIGIYITNWAGEYATAWSDGVNAGFFDTVTPASKTAFVHSAGTRTITVGSGNGGTGGYAVRNLLGAIKAVRIYDRALTDAELAQNRAADEVRFFGRAPAATGALVVASVVEGLSGNQPNGAYRPAAGYSFTAPAEAVVNGTLYECMGYTLETWDGSAWGSSRSSVNRSYSADVSSASKRLTWNWRIASRLTKIRDDYDVGDYVQDGLYLHLDGIRNAGKTADHDGTAEAWTNLGTGGASFDAVFDYANDASAGDGWTTNGYEFVYGGKFARLSANPSFGNSVTIQTVGRFNGGTSSYPSLFGSTNDFCNVYTFTAGGNAYFKVFNETRTDVLPAGSWEGKYVTAIWHKGKYVAFQYAEPERSAWNGTWNKNTTEFKSAPFYVGGIFKEGDSSYTNDRRYTGTIHAIRVYKRVLTDEELEQNRLVDEARFFGNPPESNVVVVDAGGEQAERGAYKVNGTWTFTATTVLGDNNEVKPVKGYSLETWNGSAWVRSGSGRGDSYTYTAGGSKVRLTWNALSAGVVLIVR